MILCGYLVIFAYIFGLIFLLGPAVRKRFDTENSRKVIHTMLFVVWILVDIFFKHTVHQIIIAAAFLVLNALSYKFKLYKSVERDEGNHLGTVYFAVAITAILTVSYFWKDFYVSSGVAVMCLTFGDGIAAIVGYNTRSRRLRPSKSLMGFLACFWASAAALLVFDLVYGTPLTLWGIAALALMTAILELVEHGLDNLAIVAGTFLLSYALSGQNGEEIALSALIACEIFAVVFLTGAIDYYGSLLAMGMVFAFAYWGGDFALLFLLLCYFVIFAVSKLKQHKLPGKKAGKGRNFWQILINGGFGLLFVLLYGIAEDQGCLAVSVVAVGGCFVDSLSSDLGVMSKKLPYDPFKRKQVARGLSGGMSFLGTVAALLGALLIGGAAMMALKLDIAAGALIFGLIFAQTLLDSLLGSLLQAKYRCAVCGTETERVDHCGAPTQLCGGLSWVSNNMVNLLSSVAITAIAAVIFLV